MFIINLQKVFNKNGWYWVSIFIGLRRSVNLACLECKLQRSRRRNKRNRFTPNCQKWFRNLVLTTDSFTDSTKSSRLWTEKKPSSASWPTTEKKTNTKSWSKPSATKTTFRSSTSMRERNWESGSDTSRKTKKEKLESSDQSRRAQSRTSESRPPPSSSSSVMPKKKADTNQ